MSSEHPDFELPLNMLEATPSDVQAVLDALDTLLIAGSADIGREEGLTIELSDNDIFGRVYAHMMKSMRLTHEQLAEKLSGMRLRHLYPVDGMERFSARRFAESERGTLAIIMRKYPERHIAAHIRESESGLRMYFGNDMPGTPLATVADCEELKHQLGSTFLL